VGAVCDRIAVMREGDIVEEGPAKQLLSSPQHPYTQRLLNSRPGSLKRVGVT
jgi:ABC-type dipeptide/oligopeptide/nickel transport system ATPase component